MSYIVLARKFRPQTFEELAGQGHVTAVLQEAIRQNRVAHAYLFAGPRGVGKTSTARIFAKALNCAKGPAPEPCGKCGPCASITAGSSLDVIEIDGASNRRIEEIRELREQVKFSPVEGHYRVYIIDEFHQITPDGFNAFLKTLEEPPAHVKFIFATTAPHKVPLTILSRCQRFDFKRIPRAAIVKNLTAIAKEEKMHVEEEALELVARAAEGSLRDAQMTLDQLATIGRGKVSVAEAQQLLGAIAREEIRQLVSHLIGRELTEALLLVDRMLQAGRDVTQVAGTLQDHFRQLMLLKTDPQLADALELTAEDAAQLAEQGRELTIEEILYALQMLIQAQDGIRRSPLPRVPLEIALVKIAQREHLVAMPDLLARLQALEQSLKGASSATPPAAPVRPASPPQPTPELPRSDTPVVPTSAEAVNPAVMVEAVMAQPAEGHSPLHLEALSERWHELLNRLKTIKMWVASYLEAGAPIHLQDAVLTIGFTKDYTFHKESLDRLEAKKVIEQVIGEVYAQPLRVQFSTVEELPARPLDRDLPAGQVGAGRPARPIPAVGLEEVPPPAAPPAESAARHDILHEALRIFGGKVVPRGTKP